MRSEFFIMRFSKEIKKLIKSAKIINFPIGLTEIKQIVQQSGWEIYSYKDAVEIIDSYKLQEMVEKNDSFASNIGNRIVILYNSDISQLDLPYILAHEIGHIVLGHLNDADDIGDIYAKERDCGYFADELLKYNPDNFIHKFIHKIGIFGGISTVLVALGICIFTFFGENSDNSPQISEVDVNSVSVTESEFTSKTVAETGDDTLAVYITQYGEKYHIEGCRYIKDKDDLLKISVEEAERAGYEPCEICFGK